MKAQEKLAKHMMAVTYEHLLEVGTGAYLKEVSELGEELAAYPMLIETIRRVNLTGESTIVIDSAGKYRKEE